jgi:hypothetical protein
MYTRIVDTARQCFPTRLDTYQANSGQLRIQDPEEFRRDRKGGVADSIGSLLTTCMTFMGRVEVREEQLPHGDLLNG